MEYNELETKQPQVQNEYINIYPKLVHPHTAAAAKPTAPVGEVHVAEGHSYRLQKINEIQKKIENE